MKKLLMLVLLVSTLEGGYKIYDSMLVNMIQTGKISDNGYDYNYLPDMINVLIGKNNEVVAENVQEKILSESDQFKSVIYDQNDGNYYLLTYSWAISLDEYTGHGYDEKLLSELNNQYENKSVKIFYTDYENITGFIAYNQ